MLSFHENGDSGAGPIHHYWSINVTEKKIFEY